mgnify:CR=1 FL=1|tara:strand:+ start:2230 stop:3348 length:1119 start_codon:yes stop_codon:yes gene_type:complete
MSSLRANQTIQLPGVIIPQPGTPGALVRWSADVQKAIQQLRDRGIFQQRPPVQPHRGQPLQPHHLREDDGTWKVKFREGFVYETFPPPTIPLGEEVITRHLIYVGDEDHLGSDPAPDVELESTEDYVYLHFKTDDHGKIIPLEEPDPEDEEAPTRYAELVAKTEEEKSIHFILPDGTGSNGEEGEYFYEVAKMEEDALGDAVYETGRGWRRNFHNVRGYNALENHTTGCAVFQKYDIESDTKLLRGITGDYGIDCTQTTSALDLDFDAVNVGTGACVYIPGRAGIDEAEFRCLVERVSNPQIQVDEVDPVGAGFNTSIRIQGNGNDIDIIFVDCSYSPVEKLRLVFRDGLLQSPVGVPLAGTSVTNVLGNCS